MQASKKYYLLIGFIINFSCFADGEQDNLPSCISYAQESVEDRIDNQLFEQLRVPPKLCGALFFAFKIFSAMET